MIIPVDMPVSIGKSHNTLLLDEELQELMAAEKGKNQFSPGTRAQIIQVQGISSEPMYL